jgi:hypothetical protein
MTFIQGLDASGQPLVIPALAIAGASLDLRSDDTEAILHGLERLGSVMIAPLRDAEQAVRLATVTARTGLDPWAAHVAAVAGRGGLPHPHARCGQVAGACGGPRRAAPRHRGRRSR